MKRGVQTSSNQVVAVIKRGGEKQSGGQPTFTNARRSQKVDVMIAMGIMEGGE